MRTQSLNPGYRNEYFESQQAILVSLRNISVFLQSTYLVPEFSTRRRKLPRLLPLQTKHTKQPKGGAPAMANNVNIQNFLHVFHGIYPTTNIISIEKFTICTVNNFPFDWCQFCRRMRQIGKTAWNKNIFGV